MSNKLRRGDKVDCRTPFWHGVGWVSAVWQDPISGKMAYAVRLKSGSYTIMTENEITKL